uniref:Cyclin-dependent kinase 2 homolog n=1 Tax=Euplotes crassus TaxID=5936 RepID=A0A7S3KTR7_EUPCR|mmetsp:Transcript_7689/g.7237  ORF Transcript_7689/g.7237 Transcript_7689/m.7237 type:complete len:348 (+) Transcript_7689:977-2020(+)
MHRDIKGANLLISSKGIVKLADFGLARRFNAQITHYTNRVVTLWYRAPELLLGSKNYTTSIDMWSVGCFFAELLTNKPLFPGTSESMQLDLIFGKLGFPSEENFPGVTKMGPFSQLTNKPLYKYKLREHFSNTVNSSSKADDYALDLIAKMLLYDPNKRISAADALNHPYFHSEPLPCLPSNLPQFDQDFHEYTVKMERAKQKKMEQESHNKSASSGSNGSGGSSSLKAPRKLDSLIQNENFKVQKAQKDMSANGATHLFETKHTPGEGKKIVRKRAHSEVKVFKIPANKSKVIALSSSNNLDAVPAFTQNGETTSGVDQGSIPNAGNGYFPPHPKSTSNGSDKEKV